ncbi:MAG: protein kinase [Gemmatimonadetes bacterium]|nr:protein kinase [Gemmatimonadota bacterium]
MANGAHATRRRTGAVLAPTAPTSSIVHSAPRIDTNSRAHTARAHWRPRPHRARLEGVCLRPASAPHRRPGRGLHHRARAGRRWHVAVFLATDATLGRRVVVKMLPADAAYGVSAERFKREISLSARLQHPHIVPLLSAGVSDGLPYFVMPYIEGLTLRERLRHSGEYPVADAVRLLREVASALAYAHRQGVVHRDIKPENILLTDAHAVITDFGGQGALQRHDRRLVGAHVDGDRDRHAGVHVAGAGVGRSQHRSSHRHLRLRAHRVRVAHRAPALCRTLGAGDDRRAHDRVARAGDQPAAGAATGARRTRYALSCEGRRAAPADRGRVAACAG